MSTETLIYIIIAGIAALLIALFHYIYKSKQTKLNNVFTFLRFITVFLILLLLINPKFEKSTVYIEKPRLAIALDNSESILHLKQQANLKSVLNSLEENNLLNQKFDIDYFSFGNSVNSLDSLFFREKQTNIASVFNNFNQIYKNKTAPTIIITDGNQTFGTDYEFTAKKFKQSIYPIILGDTIIHSDLRLQQLNVNKYVFLKNKFTVEMLVVYSGNTSVKSRVQIASRNSVLFSKALEFSKSNNSHSVTAIIDTKRVGVHVYNASILPLDIEENKTNNSKQFAIEVIDEKTNIALISAILHPDLGALKKAIENNQQRSVSILKPSEFLNSNEDYQLAILYQPNSSFKSVYERVNSIGINKFVITGTQTQWSFLNQSQSYYNQEITGQLEDYQPSLNSGYNTFNIEEFDFNNYPPLSSEFGKLKFNVPIETILYKTINTSVTEEPLLVTFEDNQRRESILTGEHIWKWRAQSFVNTNSFENFDNFIGKLVQYLGSSKRKSRLVVDYNSFYEGNENIVINAQYFNKNYEFEKDSKINIALVNSESEAQYKLPMIPNNTNYSVSLKDLKPGSYNFSVTVNNNEFKRSGSFTLLEYNVEKQFLNANVTKLQEVATDSSGMSFFYNEVDSLVEQLLEDNKYIAIQKSSKKIVPLIDFKYLLFLIAISLSLEWFLRKYNGLI